MTGADVEGTGRRRRGRPGPGRRAVRRAAGALALLVAAACAEAGGLETGRPDDVPGRRLLSDRWDTLFRIGGSERDTLILQATRIGADRSGVSLADGFGGRVLRFDPGGRLLWRFGRRGSGPDELGRPRALEVDDRGRTWILDVANARITVLDPAGRVDFRVPLDEVDRTVDGLAPLDGDRAVLFAFDPEAPFVTVDRRGDVERRRPFPWAGFETLSALATQMKLSGGGPDGAWAAAFAFGDGFRLFEVDGSPRAGGWFPEEVSFPGVEVRTSGSRLGRRQRVTRVERPVHGAVATALSRERLYVLFGGEGARASRWVDSYSARDGGYEGSFLLPRPVTEIAHGGDGVFYVTYDDPYPTLAAWRPSGAEAP